MCLIPILDQYDIPYVFTVICLGQPKKKLSASFKQSRSRSQIARAKAKSDVWLEKKEQEAEEAEAARRLVDGPAGWKGWRWGWV